MHQLRPRDHLIEDRHSGLLDYFVLHGRDAQRAWPLDQGVLEISRFSCMLFNQRARVLRLRRTGQPLAYNAAAVLPSYFTPCSRHCDQVTFRSSIAGPTGFTVYASTNTSRCRLQDSRPEWSRCLLSCRGLAPPTTCRFIPALGVLWAIRTEPDFE
jgi:hypothetical protein